MFTTGLTGRVLFPEAEADYISVTLASELIPPIFSGLMMIGFFSAIISTATSILLVISQAAGRDIYGQLVRKSTDESQVKVGNIVSIFVIVCVVIGNIFKTPEFLQVFLLLGQTGVGAAVCMPLFCGVLWDKATKEGAIAAAIAGPGSVIIMSYFTDTGWAWSMGACVLWAAAAMFLVSFIVHKTKGVDQDLLNNAKI